ncbi:MAG: DUF1127 domain-containing protein [Pseudomonadota bacterium]
MLPFAKDWAAFRKRRRQFAVLDRLTDEQLKDIGIPRNRIRETVLEVIDGK